MRQEKANRCAEEMAVVDSQEGHCLRKGLERQEQASEEHEETAVEDSRHDH